MRSVRWSAPLRFLSACVVGVALFTVTACSDGSDAVETTPEEMDQYFASVNSVNAEAFGRFGLLVSILNESNYVEGLSLNSRRFKQGADALRQIDPPEAFGEEHTKYAESMDALADELTQSLERISAGGDPVDEIVSQTEGSLANAFARLSDACSELARQADELGWYEPPACSRDPYFIEAVEPPWSHRVYVNRCCGGSDPFSSPLDIFYGSDESWERTAKHYKDEMEQRGFKWVQEEDQIKFSKPDRPEECFFLREYRGDDRPFAVEDSDVARLDDYDFAFVTGYTRICLG
jgi:hypothetical protein